MEQKDYKSPVEKYNDAIHAQQQKEPDTKTLFEEARLNQSLARLKAEETKSEIEFQRYKQDCRKRALEQAHYTASGIAKWIEENNLKVINRSGDKKDENEVLIMPSELVKQEIILPIADKYYNWLISIPQG